MPRFAIVSPLDATYVESDAGWSSLAARRAHNPKVTGSNPVPATKHCSTSLYNLSPTLVAGLLFSAARKAGAENRLLRNDERQKRQRDAGPARLRRRPAAPIGRRRRGSSPRTPPRTARPHRRRPPPAAPVRTARRNRRQRPARVAPRRGSGRHRPARLGRRLINFAVQTPS